MVLTRWHSQRTNSGRVRSIIGPKITPHAHLTSGFFKHSLARGRARNRDKHALRGRNVSERMDSDNIADVIRTHELVRSIGCSVSVVASLPRTASTLFCEAMAQHPSVFGCGELFIQDVSGRCYFHRKATGDSEGWYHGPAEFMDYLGGLAARARGAGKTVLLFKLMDDQEPLVWQMIEQCTSIPIFYMRRDNIVEMVASSVSSLSTGAWHGHTPEDIARANAAHVVVPADGIDQMWQRRELLEKRLQDLQNPQMMIAYDRFTSDFRASIELACGFLGIPAFAPTLTQFKLHRNPLRERVANFDALKEHYRDTELASYFGNKQDT